MEVFSVHGMRQDGESPALDVSTLKAFAFEFRFEDRVFFPKIGDDMSRVAVNVGSQPDDHKWWEYTLTSRVENRAIVSRLNIRAISEISTCMIS